ncbi:PREDICTED: uncharacterized protein LOC108377054, partial [Rhagoletis zephyria]|uniref:uncharacterized protein LOC108377054 n=1 Tax=Rhagoletis zephyria TaxID=28612 RepID=UPI000811A8F0
RPCVVYKGVPSAHLPVAHSDALQVPNHPSELETVYDCNQSIATPLPLDDGSDYIPIENNLPSFISQEHLNSLVRKLNLSHNHAMILASELKSVNVLAQGVKVTAYKHRQDPFMPYFKLSEDGTQAYCIDVAGVLNGPDIRRLMKDQGFLEILDGTAAVAWDAVRALIKHVLCTNLSPEYAIFIANLMESFDAFDVHMSLKIHMLHSHFDFYEQQRSTETDEVGERFHQSIICFQDRFAGKRLNSMLADFCWSTAGGKGY